MSFADSFFLAALILIGHLRHIIGSYNHFQSDWEYLNHIILRVARVTITVNNIIICSTVYRLTNIYRELNCKIRRLLDDVPERPNFNNIDSRRIRAIGTIYKDINDSIELFLKLFGKRMAFMVAESLFITWSEYGQMIEGNFHPAKLLVTIGLGYFFIFPCDAAGREAMKTIHLCYELRDKKFTSELVSEELERVINMEKYFIPTFTANNIFDINRKTLPYLLSTSVTYIVVITQLGHSNFTKEK
ncbi:hypothetical protein JTB14_000789 [Gonioctena quinquepunctata]|nr:hypothetical protein JTB14_000789 [Gonioctena quinquepunctata]